MHATSGAGARIGDCANTQIGCYNKFKDRSSTTAMSQKEQRLQNATAAIATDTVSGKRLPTTNRGLKTRANLIAAARHVFERDGYLDARLTDITAQAKCSTGSFYTYFENKEEVFAAVLEAAKEDMLHPKVDSLSGSSKDPYSIIEASNRAYLESYQRNAKLMGLLEQVASIDPKFRRMRRRRSTEFAQRNARGIEALQKRGIADSDLDPMLTSLALSAMVSRLAFYTYVLGEKGCLESLIFTTTRLWCNALNIPIPKSADGYQAR